MQNQEILEEINKKEWNSPNEVKENIFLKENLHKKLFKCSKVKEETLYINV